MHAFVKEYGKLI